MNDSYHGKALENQAIFHHERLIDRDSIDSTRDSFSLTGSMSESFEIDLLRRDWFGFVIERVKREQASERKRQCRQKAVLIIATTRLFAHLKSGNAKPREQQLCGVV